MPRQRDDLDEAVEYLTMNPDEIWSAWNNPYTSRGGALFDRCTPSGGYLTIFNDGSKPLSCGCLTQVRAGAWSAATATLEKKIFNDNSLPDGGEKIRVDHLPRFAHWQRLMRRYFRLFGKKLGIS